MSTATATIRELRTDFRAVKRKIEQHGEIIITDNGDPAYMMKPVAVKPEKRPQLPDYYSRVVRRQPKPLSPAETRRFWEEERGDR
ncbi:MAG: hypothetical protein HC841_05480 [Verrucomicrobiae bacterium]|nr:hypothetical protein [Verrucomicrobiae bacterium]